MEITQSSRPGVAPIARIVGEPPTLEELDTIRQQHLQVSIDWVREGINEISFLSSIADSIHSLLIFAHIPDLSLIPEMQNLERLLLRATSNAHIDISRMPRLSRFSGSFSAVPSIVGCRNLRELDLRVQDPQTVSDIDSPLEEVTLSVGRRDVAVPIFQQTDELRYLRVIGARTLDMAPVDEYQALRRIFLQRCTTLRGATSMLELKRLSLLQIQDSSQIENWTRLEELRCKEIEISGKHPFDAQFQKAVAPLGTWKFPYFVPPPRDASPPSRFDYFVHPAFQTPQPAVPGDRTLNLDAFPARWKGRSEVDQNALLRDFTAEVIAWVRLEGATSAVFEVAPYDDDDLVEKTLDDELVQTMLLDVRKLSGVRFQRGDERLAYIDENVDDGIIIRTDRAIHSFPWKT